MSEHLISARTHLADSITAVRAEIAAQQTVLDDLERALAILDPPAPVRTLVTVQYPCAQCGDLLNGPTALTAHLRAHRDGSRSGSAKPAKSGKRPPQPKKKCPHCEFASTATGLSSHVRSKHPVGSNPVVKVAASGTSVRIVNQPGIPVTPVRTAEQDMAVIYRAPIVDDEAIVIRFECAQCPFTVAASAEGEAQLRTHVLDQHSRATFASERKPFTRTIDSARL